MPKVDFSKKVDLTDVKTTNDITVNDKGISVNRTLIFENERKAKQFFDNNKFIKFSLEFIKAVTNVDNNGINVLFSLLRQNLIFLNNNTTSNLYLGINTDRGTIGTIMQDTGLSESSVKRGIKSLIFNDILLHKKDINGVAIKGTYVININYINTLNYEKWRETMKQYQDVFHIEITYNFKVRDNK